MDKRFGILLVAASFIAPTINAQDPKPVKITETVDGLVAKNIEAKGGAEALRNLKAVSLKGRMLVSQGRIELIYTEVKKRPGSVRMEITLQGMTAVQAYDGTEGWKISPFQGRKDPEKMTPDDTKSLIEEAEIDGPLVDWKEKGSTVEYLGIEDVDGTPAHKLRVSRKNGDINYVFLDPDAFLEIRIITQRTEQGAQVEMETDLGDYEKVGGVFLPFSLESGPKGATDKQKIILDKGEANVAIDDAQFRFPASPSK